MTISANHFQHAMEATPFLERIEALSQVHEWTSWNGYKVARVLDQLSAEYFAVRSTCSVMDLTPMEKYRIAGPDARAFLDRLVTRDISRLHHGDVTYVAWCNDEGKLLDDGTLFQLRDDDYRLCSQHHQLDWLSISAAGFDVRIERETAKVAALAVQGPTACTVLRAAGFAGIEEIRPFTMRGLSVGGAPVSVSRTGYTGDLGYELWLEPEHAPTIWDRIFAQGRSHDIHAIGLSALDMVRIEAGFVMPGFDFNTAETVLRRGFDRSPYEAGLGWMVHLEKGHFTGRAALAAEAARPPDRRLHRMIVAGNKPAAHALVYDRRNGNRIGEVKAATWSPILKKNVTLADIRYRNGRLPAELWARLDYQRELAWFSRWERCEIVDKPFIDRVYRSLTPPNPL